MCPLLFTLPPPRSLKVVLADLLCERVKQYQVLYDKQKKGYREKGVVRNVEQCVECGDKRPRIH